MSLQVQGLLYIHPNKDILFQNVSFSVSSGDKRAIIGNNGIGKSTLLKIMAGRLAPSAGTVLCDDRLYLVPQHFGQYNGQTVADALGLSEKLQALYAILGGRGTENDFAVLNDEWNLEEQISAAFTKWGIDYITPDMSMASLSGGEKTKVFLAGIEVFKPDMILMDEPTNHLDMKGRAQLYDFVQKTNSAIVIVSHDRALLNLMPGIFEMSSTGMQFYPMNYSQYKETVDAEYAAKVASFQNEQKELKKAEKLAQKTMERQQKHASRGEKHSAGQCIARIFMGNRRDSSEAATSHLNKVQQEKLQRMSQEVHEIRASISDDKSVKINISNSEMHGRKRLIEADGLTYRYEGRNVLWQDDPLSFSISSGERIWLQGDNGTGKTTLLKLISGTIQPTTGKIWRRDSLNILYLDQEYSCIDNDMTVYGLLESCNSKKPEHELKMLLNRFMFTAQTWDKKCVCLSGGERMKLALCCLLIAEKAPDIIIADEPTNNIDISCMDILADTLKNYVGTLLIVSHDEQFIHDIGIKRIISIS